MLQQTQAALAEHQGFAFLECFFSDFIFIKFELDTLVERRNKNSSAGWKAK